MLGWAAAAIPVGAPKEKPTSPVRPGTVSGRASSARIEARIVGTTVAGDSRSARHSGMSGTRTAAPVAATERAKRRREG